VASFRKYLTFPVIVKWSALASHRLQYHDVLLLTECVEDTAIHLWPVVRRKDGRAFCSASLLRTCLHFTCLAIASNAVAAPGCLPPPRGKRFCCRPQSRSQISNGYSYGYNDGISVDCEQYAKLGCNYVMQLNLGWSVATAKNKTAAHTFYTCLCWNKVMYITLFNIHWFFLLNRLYN